MTIIAKMGRSPYGLEAERPQPWWWVRAACRGHDPELWSHVRSWRSLPDPDGTRRLTLHASEARALAICATCPVAVDCYRDALAAHPPTAGVIRAGMFWPQPATRRRTIQ